VVYYKWFKAAASILLLAGLLTSAFVVKAEEAEEIYSRLALGERIFKEREFVPEKVKTVYLTFDDGPSKLTNKVLDILLEKDIQATFFVIGQTAEQNEDILKRIIDDGHSIGNHTYSHNYKYLYKSFSNYWEEIQKTEQIILDATGIRTSLVRTPGGTYKNWDSFYFYYMDQADYLIYDWNVDSGDATQTGKSTADIFKTIKSSKLSDKLIVLMHDSSGHQNTVEALPKIIGYYAALGYQFARLTSEVMPIIQPPTPTRWIREDEYALRSNFQRDLPESIVQGSNDSEITFVSQKQDPPIESLVNNINEKKVDIWETQPFHRKIAEAYYDYNSREWWISLNHLQRLLSINISSNSSNQVLWLSDEHTTAFLLYDQPFYLFNQGRLKKYSSLTRKGQEWFVPLKPLAEQFKLNLHWNQGLNYLIAAKDFYLD